MAELCAALPSIQRARRVAGSLQGRRDALAESMAAVQASADVLLKVCAAGMPAARREKGGGGVGGVAEVSGWRQWGKDASMWCAWVRGARGKGWCRRASH